MLRITVFLAKIFSKLEAAGVRDLPFSAPGAIVYEIVMYVREIVQFGFVPPHSLFQYYASRWGMVPS